MSYHSAHSKSIRHFSYLFSMVTFSAAIVVVSYFVLYGVV